VALEKQEIKNEEKKIVETLKDGKEDDVDVLEKEIEEENDVKLKENNEKIKENLQALASKMNMENGNMTKMFEDLAIEIDAENAEKDIMKDFESFGDFEPDLSDKNQT